MQRYYFDHNATTPVSPEVLEAMAPCFTEVYGNASSIHHFGQMAKQRLEMARRQTAALLHCRPQEIVFVSGGTEADNLALLGAVRPCQGKHVVTTVMEHPAVLGACAQIQREGRGVYGLSEKGRTALVTFAHAVEELAGEEAVIAVAQC